MITMQEITAYLSDHVSDPAPKFILMKEILGKDRSSSDYIAAYDELRQSKWYRELADEQWEDGSWGSFHGDNRREQVGRKIPCTEAAIRRMRELSLPRDDPMVVRCIKIMETYIQDERYSLELFPDQVPAQKHKNKLVKWYFPFMVAAHLNLIDPENQLLAHFRSIVVDMLKESFANGSFNPEIIIRAERDCRIARQMEPGNAYDLYLLENSDCMDDDLQDAYLSYIWSGQARYVYIPTFTSAIGQVLEDKSFLDLLTNLEAVSSFSLFPKFATREAYLCLCDETARLIRGDVKLFKSPAGHTYPCAHISFGRYADSWRDVDARKTDMVLRIARLLVKC